MITVVGSSCMAWAPEEPKGYSQLIIFCDYLLRLGIVGDGMRARPDTASCWTRTSEEDVEYVNTRSHGADAKSFPQLRQPGRWIPHGPEGPLDTAALPNFSPSIWWAATSPGKSTRPAE